MRIHLNDGWHFSLGEANRFTEVSLPHDWLIHDPQHWYEPGVGWYQRYLDTGFYRPGQRVFLRFDGVYMNSTLYVNGQKAGEWKNGFTSFEHEITPFLQHAENNTLLVKVDARFPSARWYTGAGIYRNVDLVIKNACHFVADGIYISTRRENGQWVYEVTAEVETGGQAYEVRHTLLNSGEIIPWSPEHPQLYTLRSTLYVNGQAQDCIDTRFGFRELQFDPDKGFFLNGERIKLNGVCLHQEFSIAGAAAHPDFYRRQFQALKRMGVNAVRTAHNPPSSSFMALAEELGLMVVSEFSDVWQISKTKYDYARYFDAWHERDARSWIRRDRNSPSVIMWSLGNEIPDTHADYEKGSTVLQKLKNLVALHDPKGQALPTLGSNYMAWENTQKTADEHLKLVGYNYAEYLYQKHHSQHPGWVIYGSETCSTVQSRGIYHFPLSQPILADEDLQASSLGNSTTSWGTRSVDRCIKDDRDTPFSLGQFVWSGQDYLGEPTPYQSKNSYFGMLDTAGFEKDAFYLFRSAWVKPSQAPVLHLFPYWDFSPEQMVDVRVTSNQQTVELFLNGKSLGRQEMNGEISRNWRLPYEPGLLRVQAYDSKGLLTASVDQASFGDSHQVRIQLEHWQELSFATISTVDNHGRLVQNDNRGIVVNVKGGTLLGLDNGDSTDYTPYQNNKRRLFSGKLLAVVRRTPGMHLEIDAQLDPEDIPIRKIELRKEGYEVRAVMHPRNALSQTPLWRVTTASGSDSNLAKYQVHEDGLGITLSPQGDGQVYVRCAVRNGKDHPDLYSAVTYELSGFGQATFKPFEFLSASLFSDSNVQLASGPEHGIATVLGKETWVCFDKLDFGASSSREVSLWLFPMHPEPFTFEIWEGRPDRGGTLLARPRYDLGTVWNTYLQFRVALNKPLNGLTGICLVFNTHTHLKGLVFHQLTKGFNWVHAGDCEELYGDNFKKDGSRITGIGNNTNLGFGMFDFGENGTNRLELQYQSQNLNNPLLIQFENLDGQQQAMLTLPKTQDEITTVFELGQVVLREQKVRLVFLPGSQVDLIALRFLEA